VRSGIPNPVVDTDFPWLFGHANNSRFPVRKVFPFREMMIYQQDVGAAVP
jgi:hypothetical protein